MKNIIYLHTHDTGRCISPYGYSMNTPNLDRFARGGVLFRQAFDCGPTCSPARASLLTGQYPHQCGMMGLAHRGFSLNDPSKHLANFLKANGYYTALCGMQHETTADKVASLGYLESYQGSNVMGHRHEEMGCDADNTDHACEFIRRKHQQSFFLSLGLFSTHRQFPEVPDPEDNPGYLIPPAPIPDTPDCRADWAAFSTMVRHVDRCFNKVFEALKENGLEGDTLVFVTTDHGPAFPGMKCHLNDHGSGVMLMMQLPGAPRGIVTDELVSQIDIYPTLCEWAGLAAPDWLEGKSLMPLINGEKQEIRDSVFSEINFHAARDMQRSIRTKRYRYVRRYDEYPKIVLPNIDDGLTKRFLRREAGLEEQPRIPHEQLFDLYHDPAEGNSVAENSRYAEILNEMRLKLDRWMQETNDPMLNGMPQPPPGARLNRQRGMNPQDCDLE